MVSKMGRSRFLPLLVFQIILIVLFFVFTVYRGEEDAKGFEGTHVMIFIGFGYLMTFLKRYCYSALGFNWLLAALVVQWAILCQNFFHMEDGKIGISKKTILEADIMSATVLITFGALLGVASGIQLLFIAIVETVVGCCNLYLVVDYLKAADTGGSISIHAFGAYFGLGCSLAMNFMNKPKTSEGNTEPSGPSLEGPTYGSDVTAMIGSIFLWIYWPAFNSALVVSESEYQRAVINTYLSLAAATVVTFVMSALVNEEGKCDMVHVQNSTLAGGVAIGSVANMHVGPAGALLIGTGSAILSVLGYTYLTPRLSKIGILDTCGVNNLHGMPGVYSGLLSIIFAAVATRDVYGTDMGNVFPAMGNSTIAGVVARTAPQQATYQLGALAATMVIASVAGIITGFIASLGIFKPLHKHERYNDNMDWELPE